jgi:hypothetical protein
MRLDLLLQALIDPQVAKPLVEGLLTVAVGISTYLGKKGESRTREILTDAISAHAGKTEERFDALDQSVSDLRGIVIGPDGKNGMRAQQAEMREDVKEIRELFTEKSVADGRVDERIKVIETKTVGIEGREQRVRTVEQKVEAMEAREREK